MQPPLPEGADFRAFAADTVVRMQGERALKDRKWFALMGFDSDILKSC